MVWQKKKTIKFKGELAKPIVITTRFPTLLTDTPEYRSECEKHNRAEYSRAFIEMFNKIDLLRSALNLSERNDDPVVNFALLSLALARQFVPGFKIKDLRSERGKGRKQEWNWQKYSELLADVQILMTEKVRSESEACKVLSSSSRFAKRWGKFDERTLKNRLVMAKDEDKNIVMMIINRIRSPNNKVEILFDKAFTDIFGITKNDT